MNGKKVILSLVVFILFSVMTTVLTAQSKLSENQWHYFTTDKDSELYGTTYELLKAGKISEAADFFKQYVEKQSYPFIPGMLLAATYIKMENFQEAAKVCEYLQHRRFYYIKKMARPFRKNMIYSQFYYILGTAYLKLNRYPDAVDAFRLILKSQNYKIPNSSIARLYMTGPLNTKAFYASTHYCLGTTYVHMGDKEAALEQYEKLKKLDEEKSKKLYELINHKVSSI